VQIIGETSRQAYFNIASEANIYIAPRSVEGVGLTFIEALSRGSAVVAYNGPTMNEYIRHKENGYLCSNVYAARWPSRLRRLPAKLIGQQTPRPLPDFTLSDHQPWEDIASLNWEKLGRQAAADHRDGYAAWLKSIDDYCSFLTDW
jgi:glycosyltransferase involved in cell wall biosynthesis